MKTESNNDINKRSKQTILFLCMAMICLLTACNDVFDVHPYDVNYKGETHHNKQAIAEIEQRFASRDSLRIAFISDTHGWYTNTKAEIDDINKRNDIDFVVHCGDLTDTGTKKEYERTRKILQKLDVPYVALIGNHDFLGTGDQSYQVLYGSLDFSFIAGRVKFLCLNTNATEYDYMAAVPNFDYIEQEITARADEFDRTVIIMHAPPYSDQFNNNVAKAFRRYIDFLPHLMFCVYGHNHNSVVNNIYSDGLLFYGIDCSDHRIYRIITIRKEGYDDSESIGIHCGAGL